MVSVSKACLGVIAGPPPLPPLNSPHWGHPGALAQAGHHLAPNGGQTRLLKYQECVHT
jgi:hypothetical protein